MEAITLGHAERWVTVEFRHETRWVRMRLRVAEECHRGLWVRVLPGTDIAIVGVDELSQSYGPQNWLIGIASGARFAFRALGVPLHFVELDEALGQLIAQDTETLATGAVIGIATWYGRELSDVDRSGWTVTVSDVVQVRADTTVERAGGSLSAPAGIVVKIPS